MQLPLLKVIAILAALFHCNLLLATTEAEEQNDEAKAVADAYRSIFEQYEKLEESLEADDYDIRSPEDSDVAPEVIARDSKRFKEGLAPIYEELSKLQAAPSVDWGYTEELIEKGPMASLSHPVASLRVVRSAGWYAKEIWGEQPDVALDVILTGLSTVRHQNQQPTFITSLMENAGSNLLSTCLAELAPQMTTDQKAYVLARLAQLPETGTLADGVLADRDTFVGWYKKNLQTALEEWESENYGINNTRFPEDLRLAGLLLLSGAPVRISLHNIRTDQSFWLEKGKEKHGIQIIKVDRKTEQAWIRKDGQTAIIDLQKKTIQNRTVPWEVLIEVFANDWMGTTDSSEEELIEELKEMGITPESILDELDKLYTYYTEAASKLDLPLDEFEAWAEARLEGVSEDSFFGMIAPSMTKMARIKAARQSREEALKIGMNLLQKGNVANSTVNVSNTEYSIQKTDSGFKITPVEFLNHEMADRSTLHFGAQPPEDED